MLMSEAFPSAFLKAEDLLKSPQRRVTAQIRSCEYEEVGSDKLPVVRFSNKNAGLVLNKTNSNTLTDAFGDNTDLWGGKSIEIYVTKVDYKGALVDGLRVNIPQQNAQPAPQAEVVHVDDDSDVPF